MNETTTMDGAAKQRVRAALLEQAEHALQGLTSQVADDHSAAEVDQDDSTSVDDISQADEAGDLGALFEQSEAHRRAALKQIEGLDFAVTDTVAPGAVVGFDGARFVVGVVTDGFECDGVTYEGISEDAPIFAPMAGLRLGDEFTFNDQAHRIDFLA